MSSAIAAQPSSHRAEEEIIRIRSGFLNIFYLSVENALITNHQKMIDLIFFIAWEGRAHLRSGFTIFSVRG